MINSIYRFFSNVLNIRAFHEAKKKQAIITRYDDLSSRLKRPHSVRIQGCGPIVIAGAERYLSVVPNVDSTAVVISKYITRLSASNSPVILYRFLG